LPPSYILDLIFEKKKIIIHQEHIKIWLTSVFERVLQNR